MTLNIKDIICFKEHEKQLQLKEEQSSIKLCGLAPNLVHCYTFESLALLAQQAHKVIEETTDYYQFYYKGVKFICLK